MLELYFIPEFKPSVFEVSEITDETTVVNVSKKELGNYKDFVEWSADPSNVYIGRNMSFYVKGAKASKWANPFDVKKFGRERCIEKYKDYLLSNRSLLNSIMELKGKKLGCWCKPEACHGDVLVEVLKQLDEGNYKVIQHDSHPLMPTEIKGNTINILGSLKNNQSDV